MSHVRNAPSSQESSSSEDLIILPHNLSSLTERSVLFYSEIWLVPGGAGQVCTLNLRPCCVSHSDAFNYAPTQSFPRQPSTSHPITCFQTSFLCWAASEDLESSAANRVCVCTVRVWMMISGQRVRFARHTHMQKRLFWGKSASGAHPAAQSDRRTFTQSSLCTWEEEREKAKINDGLYFSQPSLFNSESNYFRFSTSEGRSERKWERKLHRDDTLN